MTDPLDKRLKDWSSHTAMDDKAIARLEQHTTMEMRKSRHFDSASLQETSAFSPWGRVAWFALGAAAALTMTLTFVRLPPRVNGMKEPQFAGTPEAIYRLFNEVDRLFAGNLQWIAQSDGAVELGINPDGEEWVHEGEPLAVHIAVVSRSGNEEPWTKVWESDIFTRSEQAVEIAPDKKRDNRVALWIYPVAEGKFAVDSRISLNAPVRVHSDSSDIVQDGKPTPVAVMSVGSREYRVYQTVTRLKPNAGPISDTRAIRGRLSPS